MTEQEITGEIENVKEKAVAIENNWYNSFNKLTDFNKGDTVKIIYKENKGFKNIKSITKIDITNQVKTKINDTTINTLLMNINNIVVSVINNRKEVDIKSLHELVTESVLKSYHHIKDNI